MLATLLFGGCAILREFGPAVAVEARTPGEYIALKRGDILTSDKLSAATMETIRVAGLDGEGACARTDVACIQALADIEGLSEERRLSALCELWLQQALEQSAARRRRESAADNHAGAGADADGNLDAWVEVARHAYGYLFFSGRTPGERAFEDRQTQVRDYYNLAAQEIASLLFKGLARDDVTYDQTGRVQLGKWTFHVDLSGLRLPGENTLPLELLPASSLFFEGLRSTYRRDGFGAELVAVMAEDPVTTRSQEAATEGGASGLRAQAPGWSEMPSPVITALLYFQGEDLAQVLATHEVALTAHDPYREAEIRLNGLSVPLAANFTAGYGLWLARSGFNRQSMYSLVGSERGIDRPHLYLMQPYDPQRRVIVTIHGLASSPEAWVNVANELMGDEELRSHFQVWQFYYPTNMPIALNHYTIRQTLDDAMRHFDPQGTAPASHDSVLIGHSMGGVISRLMVSSSGDALWDHVVEGREFDDGRLDRLRRSVGPMLRFEPVPAVERAIFVAAPHRGTEAARSTFARVIGRVVRLPWTLLEGFGDVLQGLALAGEAQAAEGGARKAPNSIDNLDPSDPFIQAAADLPISPCVRYHSIIGHEDPKVPLAESDDGLVPYWSSHLQSAVSEKIVRSSHSVQETAPAIIEMRRILREDILERNTGTSAVARDARCRR